MRQRRSLWFRWAICLILWKHSFIKTSQTTYLKVIQNWFFDYYITTMFLNRIIFNLAHHYFNASAPWYILAFLKRKGLVTSSSVNVSFFPLNLLNEWNAGSYYPSLQSTRIFQLGKNILNCKMWHTIFNTNLT